jgi:PIN domain nuclease of toxin-antitoxin system
VSAPIPEIAVADTHALLWWLAGTPERLGRRARQFFQRVDAGRAVLCVPAVALVELSEAMQLGRVSLGEPFAAFVARLAGTPGRYQVVPLTAEIVARSHDLFAIPERGDRLIAATAAELGYPLVTRDPEIVAAIAGDHLW